MELSWNRPPRVTVHDCIKATNKNNNNKISCWLFVWFLNVLVNYYVISRAGPKTGRLNILRAATHETELGDHDFCLSRSHYTDTDPTSRERAATAGIEPETSSRALYRLSKLAPPPPNNSNNNNKKQHIKNQKKKKTKKKNKKKQKKIK